MTSLSAYTSLSVWMFVCVCLNFVYPLVSPIIDFSLFVSLRPPLSPPSLSLCVLLSVSVSLSLSLSRRISLSLLFVPLLPFLSVSCPHFLLPFVSLSIRLSPSPLSLRFSLFISLYVYLSIRLSPPSPLSLRVSLSSLSTYLSPSVSFPFASLPPFLSLRSVHSSVRSGSLLASSRSDGRPKDVTYGLWLRHCNQWSMLDNNSLCTK